MPGGEIGRAIGIGLLDRPYLTPGVHPPSCVQGLEQRWQELYAGRFGCSRLSREAEKLAGTWQRLYKLKHQSDQAANGWDRLSQVEMRAAAARFAQRTVEGRLHVVFLLDGSGSVTEGAPGWAQLGCLHCSKSRYLVPFALL